MQKDYCCLTIDKVKTFQKLNAKYRHNLRVYQPANADPTLAQFNDEIIKLNGKTYNDVVKEKIRELQEAGTVKTVRKDAVIALEVVTTFSKDALKDVDLDAWKENNRKWLNETFNQADNTDNVISMVFHADEAGEVHIHSIVIPITADGRLCAKEFTGGKKTMRAIQDSYGELMKKEHNLKRGIRHSVAKHEDIKRFYGAVNKSLDMTNLEPSEREITDRDIVNYSNRVKEHVKDLNLQNLAEKKDLERELVEAQSLCTQQIFELNRLKRENEEKDKALSKTLKKISNKLDDEDMSLDEFEKRMKTMSAFERGLKHFPDRERAKEIAEGYDEIVRYQRKQEKQHKYDIEKTFYKGAN